MTGKGDDVPAGHWKDWVRAHRAGLIRGVVAITLLLLLIGLYAYLQPHTWRYYTDGVSVRRLARDTDPRMVLWEDSVAEPCSARLPADLSDPFVLEDGVTMVFAAGMASGNSDLFMSRWDGRAWGAPTPLPALNSAFNESGPVVSPDGQTLFFSSDRPGGLGGYDIWVARWDGLTWAWPANLGYMINSKFDDLEPAVSPFDGRLFFTSDRAKRRLSNEEDSLPVKALRERLRGRDFDLYAADQVPVDAAITREIERMQSQLYSLRTGALSDPEVMRKLGGSRETEAAVDRALAWLAANQESNGCWTAGVKGHEPAATGFALLTFLGRGVKPNDGSRYSGVVSNALGWLVRSATLGGDMRGSGNMYDQGVATLALAEAYGLTKDEKLKEAAQAAVNFVVDAQHEDGGWRYAPKQAGDLSVASWQIMAMKSAELSGLVVSETCLARARAWLRDKMVAGPNNGIYGYTAGGSGQPAMQAAGFFCSQLLGISPNSARARESVDALVRHGMKSGQIGIYYWYNAVLGSYQYQGPFWQEWSQRLVDEYLPAQCRDGDLAGSWNPAGNAHGEQMGRVIVTAMHTLSLEVYYRYTPLYGLGYNPHSQAAGRDGWDADRIASVPQYRRARPVEALNTAAEERRPSFTRRGDFVYFSSNRGGGIGGHDVYRARVTGATEAGPENVGPEINTTADEMTPALRLTGFKLLFTSNRAGTPAGAPRLFSSTSRYVRAIHDYTQTRGLADQLLKHPELLVLLVVALLCVLLFTWRCRRSADDDDRSVVAAAMGPADTPETTPRRRRRGSLLAWVGLALSTLAFLGFLGAIILTLHRTVWCRYTDDVSITKQAQDVTPRPVVWEFPAPLGSQFTGLVARTAQSLSPDGVSLLFAGSGGMTGTTDVLMSTWDGHAWSTATPVAGINSFTNSEQDAVITRDGERMFFVSDRPGGFGGLDVWTAVRHNGGWVGASNLGASVNSPGNEVSPFPSPDGKRLYFASDRTDRPQKDFDIFAADILEGGNQTTSEPVEVEPASVAPDDDKTKPASARGANRAKRKARAVTGAPSASTSAVPSSAISLAIARPVDPLNSPANELHCSFTSRGDWLNFASDRRRGRGRFDAYSARILDGRAGQVVNLGSEINTPSDEQSTAIGMDGFQIVFASDRFAGVAARERPYIAHACEVVGKWDLSRWYSLGDLLYRLRWWILLALVAIACIIYLLTHLRDFTSLRAKCILISLLIHLIFLLLTSVWMISSEFAESRDALAKEASLSIDNLAQEKLALDVREEVMKLPQAKVTAVAEQADEELPVPDFTPVQRAVQTVVARSVTESFVAESAPSAKTPETRQTPAPKLPDLPDIQPPKVDVALKVESRPTTEIEVKAAEAFQPMVNVPDVSTARADVKLPGSKPEIKPAEAADVPEATQAAQAAGSLVAESTPAAKTPEAREIPAPSLPKITDIQPPKVDVALKVETPLGNAAEGKTTEKFQPMVNAPALSSERADVALPGPKPVLRSAGAADVLRTNQVARAADSRSQDTGGPVETESGGGAESFVAESALSPRKGTGAGTPETRPTAATGLPGLSELRSPDVKVAMAVGNPLGGATQGKATDSFQPLDKAPAVSTERADVAMPGSEQPLASLDVTGANPVDRATAALVRGTGKVLPGTTESFVAESAPVAGTPETRQTPASRLPGLEAIQRPNVDIAMKVENPLSTAAEGKAGEAFQPMVNVPAVSTTRADVALPGRKPMPASAAVEDVKANQIAQVASSLVRDTGGLTAIASRGGDVSAGMTEVKGPGTRIAGQLGGGVAQLKANLPGKLDVPSGHGVQVSPYKLRNEGHDNKEFLEGLGGNSATEGSVAMALDWFTRNQEPDGHWSIAKHGGQANHDMAATGIALLCYLGWGVKHHEPGKYQKPAADAVAWLTSRVKANGDARGDGNMYDHGIATIALGEAYALTKDKSLGVVVSNMVYFIVRAQHPKTGGWRYAPGDPGDTSVFGWQLMAILSARMAGIPVPDETIAGAEKWLTSVGGGSGGGLYGYSGRNPARSMAAEGMFCRQIMGVLTDDPRMGETAGYLTMQLPSAAHADFYYWYYATLAMYQHRGPGWEAWNERLKLVLPPLQIKTGDKAGSWDPKGLHGAAMGRVVSTAMATLSLEVYYRYLPFSFTKGSAPAPAESVQAPVRPTE